MEQELSTRWYIITLHFAHDMRVYLIINYSHGNNYPLTSNLMKCLFSISKRNIVAYWILKDLRSRICGELLKNHSRAVIGFRHFYRGSRKLISLKAVFTFIVNILLIYFILFPINARGIWIMICVHLFDMRNMDNDIFVCIYLTSVPEKHSRVCTKRPYDWQITGIAPILIKHSVREKMMLFYMIWFAAVLGGCPRRLPMTAPHETASEQASIRLM